MGVQNDWAHGHPIMRSVTSYDALFDTGSSIGSAPSFKGGFTRKGPRAPFVEAPASPTASSPVQRAARAREVRAPSKQSHSPQAQPSDSRTSFREMLAHRHQTSSTKPKPKPKPTGTRPCPPCHNRAALNTSHALALAVEHPVCSSNPLERGSGLGLCSAATTASRARTAPVRYRCPALAQARPEVHPLPPIHQTGAARGLEGPSPRRCAHPASSHRCILGSGIKALAH